MPKLRKVKNKLDMPHILVPVSVPSIKGRTFTGTGLRLRQQPDSVRSFIVRCLWQQLLNKGGHGYNGGVLPGRQVDLVPL